MTASITPALSLPWCPDQHRANWTRHRSRVRRMKGMRRQPNPAARPHPSFPYLRAAEVADILHVSPKTVSRWAKDGKLPFLKTLGGHRRYPAAEIRQLADALQVRPTASGRAPPGVEQVAFWLGC